MPRVRVPPESEDVRPSPCFSDSLTSFLDERKADNNPTAIPVNKETPRANANTQPSKAISVDRGSRCAKNLTINSTPYLPKTNPPPPPPSPPTPLHPVTP